MADEFVKGLTIFSGAALLWMILAGWYRTPSFYDRQFTGPRPEDPSTWDALGLVVMDSMFWFMILGPLAFWVLIPLFRRGRAAYARRRADGQGQ